MRNIIVGSMVTALMAPADVLPNGRSAGSATPDEAEHRRMMLKAARDSAETGQNRVELAGGEVIEFDARLIRKGVDAIKSNIKTGVATFRTIVEIVRACETSDMAESVLFRIERKVCKDEEVKTLSDLKRKFGMASLPWETSKSTVLSAMRNEKKWKKELQDYLDFRAKHENANEEKLHGDFLNIFSDRYANSDGHTLFAKDAQRARTAKREHDAALARYKKRSEQGKEGVVESVKGATPGETASAVTQSLKPKIQEAYIELSRKLRDANVVSPPVAEADIIACLNRCWTDLDKLIKAETDKINAKLKEKDKSTNRPNKAVVDMARARREGKALPDVPMTAAQAENDAAHK